MINALILAFLLTATGGSVPVDNSISINACHPTVTCEPIVR